MPAGYVGRGGTRFAVRTGGASPVTTGREEYRHGPRAVQVLYRRLRAVCPGVLALRRRLPVRGGRGGPGRVHPPRPRLCPHLLDRGVVHEPGVAVRPRPVPGLRRGVRRLRRRVRQTPDGPLPAVRRGVPPDGRDRRLSRGPVPSAGMIPVFPLVGQLVARSWPLALVAWAALLAGLWVWAPPWDRSARAASSPTSRPTPRAVRVCEGAGRTGIGRVRTEPARMTVPCRDHGVTYRRCAGAVTWRVAVADAGRPAGAAGRKLRLFACACARPLPRSGAPIPRARSGHGVTSGGAHA